MTSKEAAQFRELHRMFSAPANAPSIYSFVPRPDKPELYDQQTGFLESRAKISVCLGGTGSGKTETAAHRAARFMLWKQKPPRPDTPFMIVSDTYLQVSNICWKEKLSRIIPADQVDWDRCQWYQPRQKLPYVINLRPWPGTDNSWSIEFRSMDQGRENFQGRSIGGFWVSEQLDFELFEELQGRCREYWFSGGQFVECTPIDPDLAIPLEERYDEWTAGNLPDWDFFRLNSDRNDKVAPGFFKSYWTSVSEELLATRQTGAFPSFLGAIYPSFNPAVHLVDDEGWKKLYGKKPPGRYCDLEEFRESMPQNVFYRRGIDWGESVEHPFVCLWLMKDGAGNWVVFDEYYEDTGLVFYDDRREEIKIRWPWKSEDPHFGSTYADPSRPLLIAEFCADGIMTSPASNSVENGIEYVRNLLKPNKITKRPKLIIHKGNCPRLAKEMRKYRWVRGVTQGKNPHVARAVPLKYQDDGPDALRYATYSDRVPTFDNGPDSVFVGAEPQRYGLNFTGRRR